MSTAPFRFLHAADLHLDRAMVGIAEVPEHLRDAWIDAPYGAAERVFDTAIVEQVNFVVLSGDVVNVSRANPRAMAFLLGQFERLAESGVSVYWGEGRIDRLAAWPDEVPLPDGVHLLDRRDTREHVACRENQPVAAIVGRAAVARRRGSGESRGSGDSLPAVATVHGRIRVSRVGEYGVDYWALGGSHTHRQLSGPPAAAVYAGTCQGRSVREHGPRGCVLVEFASRDDVRTQFIPTDAVRWHVEQLELPPGETFDSMREAIRARMLELAVESAGRPLLVQWQLREADAAPVASTRGSWRDDLVADFREELGHRETPVWTVSLELESSSLPPEWLDEDTIAGQFLRTVSQYESDAELPISLDRYVPSELAGSPLAAALAIGGERRSGVLREVAVLGAELLRGDGYESRESRHKEAAP